jgi:hypothetical protein
MTVVTGSIRWTDNLLDRADVAARDVLQWRVGKRQQLLGARGSA